MNPYIGDDAIAHMDSIMKNVFTPDELAEINSDIDNEIQMIEAAQEAHEKGLISQQAYDYFGDIIEAFNAIGKPLTIRPAV